MGIIKRAADLTYTFRFIRMLVMRWENWDAYKMGIIDKEGKRIKEKKIETSEEKASYTPFIRLCANIKRLVSKVPGGGSKLGSFAAALFLIKEKYNLNDTHLKKILEEVGVESLDFLSESSQWFVLEDKQLSPGLYRVFEGKILNSTCEEFCFPRDQIRIEDDCYPIGDVFGLDIYEATHVKTNQQIYVTISEIFK